MAITSYSGVSLINQSSYSEDTYIRVLGCADQFQICVPAHTECTPLTGTEALFDAMNTMQLNDVQKNISQILFVALVTQPTSRNVNFRGLRASDELAEENVFHPGLLINQWTIEMLILHEMK